MKLIICYVSFRKKSQNVVSLIAFQDGFVFKFCNVMLRYVCGKVHRYRDKDPFVLFKNDSICPGIHFSSVMWTSEKKVV